MRPAQLTPAGTPTAASSRLVITSSTMPYSLASFALMMKSRSVSFGDLLDRLAGVVRQDLVERLAHADDLLGLDLDVDRLARRATVRLVDEHPGVREDEALARASPAARITAAADAAWPMQIVRHVAA